MPQEIPELLRLPLEQLCLRVKALGHDDLQDFLGKLLDPPKAESVLHGIHVLTEVNAIDSTGTLTSLGRMLAEIQADLRIGKMLIFGSILRCIDSALTIAACLVRAPCNCQKEEEKGKSGVDWGKCGGGNGVCDKGLGLLPDDGIKRKTKGKGSINHYC